MKYIILMLFICSAVFMSNTFAGGSNTQHLTDDTVIATWQPSGTPIQTIAEAEELLTASRYLSAKGRRARACGVVRANAAAITTKPN